MLENQFVRQISNFIVTRCTVQSDAYIWIAWGEHQQCKQCII